MLILLSKKYPKFTFGEYTSTLNLERVYHKYLVLVNPCCLTGHRNKCAPGERGLAYYEEL